MARACSGVGRGAVRRRRPGTRPGCGTPRCRLPRCPCTWSSEHVRLVAATVGVSERTVWQWVQTWSRPAPVARTGPGFGIDAELRVRLAYWRGNASALHLNSSMLRVYARRRPGGTIHDRGPCRAFLGDHAPHDVRKSKKAPPVPAQTPPRPAAPRSTPPVQHPGYQWVRRGSPRARA